MIDPDPTCQVIMDPDPTCQVNSDPDPDDKKFTIPADPDCNNTEIKR